MRPFRRLLFTALVLLPAVPAAAQQRPELPPEVQAWMNQNWQPRFMALIALGDSLFNNGTCARCHGQGGVNGRNGPDLTSDGWNQSDGSLDGIFQTIFWGVRRRDFSDTSRRFEMNPQGGMSLSWDELRAVAAYVWSLNKLPKPAPPGT
jgi:mono/diheme cytochrome c family protein